MPSSTPGLTAILTRIKRGPERSSLFHFMVEHHDQFARAATGTRVPWTELVGLFMAEGLTAADGGPITEAIARHVWWRARRAVEKERERKAAVKAAKVPAARSLMPSALPQSWRPTQVLLPPAPPPDPVPSRPAGASPPDSRSAGTTHADAQLARLRRHADERSGRKPPSS